MKLVVGLGNPGPEYDRTRHNVGFDVVDRLARRFASGAVARARFQGACIDTDIDGERTLLIKPGTFMNLSGQTVAEAIRFYKLDPTESLLIVVDDVALSCGTIRLRPGGSAGGHNGLGDISQRLGTDDFPRLRIGIDPPGNIAQKSYVLGRFTPDQIEQLGPALEAATDAVRGWLVAGIDDAMNRFNRKNTAETLTD